MMTVSLCAMIGNQIANQMTTEEPFLVEAGVMHSVSIITVLMANVPMDRVSVSDVRTELLGILAVSLICGRTYYIL